MYNKLKFNNLLISSKKQIEKGRAQVIQKCVQKVRKFKILTEKTPENKRHEQCLRKTLMYMDNIKKLKSIDIIKGILLMTKPATAVLTNGRATVEEIVVAMLSMNKIIQTIVDHFREELNLDSNDQSWRKQIQEISKRRAKIERTEEKRRRRKEQKDQKSLARKRQEWLEVKHTLQNDSEETLNTTNGTWKEEIVTQEQPTKSNIRLKNERKTLVKENVQAVEPLLKKLCESEPKEIQEEKQDEGTTQVVDSFFITNTGENYLSTVIVEKGQHDVKNYDRDGGKTITGLHHKQNDFKHNNTKYNGNYSGEQNSQRKRFQPQKPDTSVNKLHPSWEAKQRFRPIINNFQGKRITFNDNVSKNNEQEPEPIAEKLHPSWEAKQRFRPIINNFQGKRITFNDNVSKNNQQDNEPIAEKLHPSWAAKQKLKPVITAFQGKKILFE